ncbi:MAG: hypothetical protein HXX11_15985 [Desulfuromonadales bacterium]|nr:hypothetical protein [Desulfuromonadales bacterium]
MKKTLSVCGLALALSFIYGCNSAITEIKNPMINPSGNFTLYVSNQSYENKNVDILVKLDGAPVLHEYFRVGNQHKWKEFKLQIPNGTHKLEAVSQKGRAMLEQLFEVNGKRWAVLDYCYGKGEGHKCPSPVLNLNVSDSPIGFM